MGKSVPRLQLENNYLRRTYGIPLNINHYTRGSFLIHYHSFLEIMIINKTSGRQYINNQLHELLKNQAYCLGPYHFHKLEQTSAENLDYFNIVFAPEVVATLLPGRTTAVKNTMDSLYLKPFFSPNRTKPIALPEKEYRDITTLCKMFINALASPSTAIVHVTYNLFNTILAMLMPFFPPASAYKEEEMISYDLLRLINKSYTEELQTEKIAADFHLSPSRLSQIVKKETGKTIKEMLIQRRLLEAKRLLTGSDYPITYIAMQSGFNDISHFNKTFKKDTGQTPSQYRNSIIIKKT